VRHLHILCEGQTEEILVQDVLKPHFVGADAMVTYSIIAAKRPAGGPAFKGVPGRLPAARLRQRAADPVAAVHAGAAPWLSLWSTDDQTVQPPGSARLLGAVNVPLQSVCPGANIQHSQLPTAPLVVGLVLRALASNRLTAPPPGDCATLQSIGR
jgi:hypothetical protein